MRIIGIDPGLATVGYGIVDAIGSKLKCVTYGTILTPAHTPLAERLSTIYSDMSQLLHEFQPESVAIESLFFNKNTTTAMAVSQARGVILLACQLQGKPMADYTPIQVKTGVVGYGKATKQQVQYMVQKLLGLEKKPRPDDAADGLALAICHAHSGPIATQASR